MSRVAAQDDGSDRVLVEVQGDPERAVLELEQLVHRRHGQPADPGDAVPDLGDPAYLLGGYLRRVLVDVSLSAAAISSALMVSSAIRSVLLALPPRA